MDTHPHSGSFDFLHSIIRMSRGKISLTCNTSTNAEVTDSHNGWPALLWTWKHELCSQIPDPFKWSVELTSHASRFKHFLNVLRVAFARRNKNQIFPTWVILAHLHQSRGGINSVFNSCFSKQIKHGKANSLEVSEVQTNSQDVYKRKTLKTIN